MRSFGVVNEVDDGGCVDLPDIFMDMCDIRTGESLEMYLEDESIVLKHSAPICTFCGATSNLSEYKRKSVCQICAEELKNYKI